MNAMAPYSIPILGLKAGVHHLKYQLDAAFFRHFEGSPIEEARIEVGLIFDKRPDMMLLDFELSGTVGAVCDRCTADIHLPIADTRQLIIKYGDAEGETEDEVVFIPREVSEFNVGKYLYEFSILALPITNTYDCQNDAAPPCNFDILKYLEKDTGEGKTDAIWDSLKGFNNN